MIAISPGVLSAGDPQRTFTLYEDFYSLTSGQLWTETSGDVTATVTVDADGLGGIVDLFTDATNNNEAILESTTELLKFAVDKPFAIEFMVNWTESATDDANVLAGVMDAPGADSLLDDGGGPKASYSGACFFKVDGSTVWQCETSIGGTQQTTTLNTTDRGNLAGRAMTAGGAWQRLRIEFDCNSLTTAEVRFYIDDELVCRHQNVDVTSATEMAIALAVKAGSASAETLRCDYVKLEATR